MNPDGQKPHILCINHAPEILELLRNLLEEEGFRVSTMQTIDHSLDAIVDLNPDVITIDYMWSTTDNEWTYLNLMTIDPRTRGIPVILCTGEIGRATQMESHLKSLGIRMVFKPFDLEHLLTAISDALQPTISTKPDVVQSED